jgi:hypothetical protein
MICYGCRLDERLEELEEEVSEECEALRLQLSTDHAGYASRIARTEKQLNQLQISLDTLEQQSDELVAFGRNVGTPFVDLKQHKEKAMAMADILDHLTLFSHCQDLSSLPSSFHDDADIEKSATLVQSLMAAIQSVADISESSMMQSKTSQSVVTGQQLGTLGAAWEQLVLYLNILDNRIVGNFDRAADSKDIAGMAYYVRVMDKAHGDSSRGTSLLISRYISRNMMFMSPDHLLEKIDLKNESEDASVKVHGLDSQGHVEASRRITYACHHLSDSVREECTILEQIFGEESAKAISMFITRVFEDTLADTIQKAFALASSTGRESATTKLRDDLRLTCETYRKVYNLADEACHVVSHLEDNQGISVVELAASAMGMLLGKYPSQEKQWHKMLGASTIGKNTKDSIVLNKEIILNLISVNEESIQRCIQVVPSGQRGQFIKELFYSKNTSDEGQASSLLDYVGTYMMETLTQMEQQAARQIDSHAMWRNTVVDSTSISSAIHSSIGKLVQGCITASDIFATLKEHYKNDVSKFLPPNDDDPWMALLGLQKGVEDHIALILQKLMQLVISKIRDILHAFQLKSEFLIDGSTTADLEKPTPVCVKACAIMSTVIETIKGSLKGTNYQNYIQTLARNFEYTVESHVLKFFYTPGGALRLKRDITAYSECISSSNVPSTKKTFDDMAAMSNILVVGSKSVHEMVESVSYLDKERVDRFLKRRYHK